MTIAREDLLSFARQLANPNFSLTVPSAAKSVIRQLVNAIEAQAAVPTANPVLEDAYRYKAERGQMNNPKGWDHVLRQVEGAVSRNPWSATAEQIDAALVTIRRLASLPALPADEVEREALAGLIWKKLHDLLGSPGVDAWASGQVADTVLAAGYQFAPKRELETIVSLEMLELLPVGSAVHSAVYGVAYLDESGWHFDGSYDEFLNRPRNRASDLVTLCGLPLTLLDVPGIG